MVKDSWEKMISTEKWTKLMQAEVGHMADGSGFFFRCFSGKMMTWWLDSQDALE